MNRTDRLYALVDELRRHRAPVPARRLADRFEVTTRTIERDILALQEAGVPVYAEPGRLGGYVLDASRALPPVNFTPAEAAAVAVALAADSPLPQAARSALNKILAAMPPDAVEAARSLGGRVLRFVPDDGDGSSVSRTIEQAVVERRVTRLLYHDKKGEPSERVVEPMAVIGKEPHWYLGAWCRTRDAFRTFRMDRISEAHLTTEVAPVREVPDISRGLAPLRALPIFE